MLQILPQYLVAGLIFLGIAAGGDAGELAEGADKMGVVGKTGQFPGLLDADSVLKQLPRPENPAVNDIFHHGKAGGSLENAAQIVLADIKMAGNPVQRKRFRQIIPDIVQDGGYPQKILVADGFTRGGGVEGGRHADQQIEQVDNRIYDPAFDFQMEYFIDINVVIKNEEQFNYWLGVLPFYDNVKKEGIVLNG